MKTYSELKTYFKETFVPGIPADDEVMLNEEWNNYTDSECKDGEITNLQYHHCPSYEDCPEDDTEDEDRAFILGAMGVRATIMSVDRRPDWNDEYSKTQNHWGFTLSRGKHEHGGYYSQGSAVLGAPDVVDLIGSLLADTTDYEPDFDDWCSNTGEDTDSRRAYAAWETIGKENEFLTAAFNKSEMEYLRQMFEYR